MTPNELVLREIARRRCEAFKNVLAGHGIELDPVLDHYIIGLLEGAVNEYDVATGVTRQRC